MQNYCSIIHGGLFITFDTDDTFAHHCCLRSDRFKVDESVSFWTSKDFQTLRDFNLTDQWHSGCSNCRLLESAGHVSFRNGMNDGLGIYGQTNVSGPARIDLKFDRSCNLACRICGPGDSSFWQKHLSEHGEWNKPIHVPRSKHKVIATMSQLDLSNLKMLVFCGGETLLGQEYWDVAEWFVETVPHAKQNLTMCFQTNGTQTISEKNYKTIQKSHLVKLHISLDGIGQQFEFQRWPASWSQVEQNLFDLRQNLPSNTMFLVEETISIFNFYYLDRLQKWCDANFTTNREGDVVLKTQHLAWNHFDIRHCLSQEYVDAMQNSPYKNFIDSNWQEQPDRIRRMISEIQKIDGYRKQDWTKIFPEVAEFYRRYL